MEKSRELVTEYHIPLQDTQRPGERQNVLIEAGTQSIRITAEGEDREIFVQRVDGVIQVSHRPLDWETNPDYQKVTLERTGQ